MKILPRYLSLAFLLLFFASCSEKSNGIIELKSLKKDTVIAINTNVERPDNLTLYIKNKSRSTFYIDHIKLDSSVLKDTISMDRYTSNTSIHIIVLNTNNKSGADIEIKYILSSSGF